MARINIEEESWVRIYRLAEYMGCSVREAAGTVACLWHRSQDLVKATGTREDIIDWASLSKNSEKEIEKWILGLEKSRFIFMQENNAFEIKGNAIQIENRISKTNKASKGGKALKKKLSELKKLKAGLKQAPSTLGAGSRGLNAIQFNAVQGNAGQSNSKQDNAIQISQISAKPQKTKSFIALYCELFKSKYGSNPEIQKKDAGIAKRISESLSEEKVELYLQAYFAIPDAWLVKTKHPISAFETKLNEVVVFANTGNFTTQKQVQQADGMVTNALLLEQVRKGIA